jgi:hypothetical protein
LAPKAGRFAAELWAALALLGCEADGASGAACCGAGVRETGGVFCAELSDLLEGAVVVGAVVA